MFFEAMGQLTKQLFIEGHAYCARFPLPTLTASKLP
jgi:hypothetical protein